MNKFSFQVSAVDKFTKVFRNLNDQASRSLRPITNLQRSSAMLFREMHLPQVARGLAATGRAAQTLASGLGQVAAPMASLAGLGTGVGIIGLVAGLTSITATWAKQGAEVTRTARSIGIATDQLQRYRGAAQLVDLTAEDATSAIANFASTIQDAQFGRNPQALMMLDHLGIKLQKTKDGLVDLPAMLEQASRAISKYSNPQTQRVIAASLGVESILPMLRDGPGALRARLGEAEALGGVRSPAELRKAAQFQQELNRLGIAATGQAGRAADASSGALIGPVRAARQLMSPAVEGPAPSQEEADALKGRFVPFSGRRGERAQVDVNVKVAAPAGTTVTATSNSPSVPVRIGRTNDTP